MSETRHEPDKATRKYAMDQAVSIVNSNSFNKPGLAALDIAEAIADYITNGPKESK